jgi:hypothetical protein
MISGNFAALKFYVFCVILSAMIYLLEEWEKFAPSENRWAKGWKNGRGKKDSSCR